MEAFNSGGVLHIHYNKVPPCFPRPFQETTDTAHELDYPFKGTMIIEFESDEYTIWPVNNLTNAQLDDMYVNFLFHYRNVIGVYLHKEDYDDYMKQFGDKTRVNVDGN
jgi:hypothetical protein